jgi:hypothetical protein
MKIIEQGTRPEQIPYTARCRNCNTKFEFLKVEAKERADFRDGDYLEAECPTCGDPCTVAL